VTNACSTWDDLRATAVYADALRALGAADVQRRRLGPRFWWGNPFAATTLLTAAKPRRD
jgi:arsenite methyltransferase